MASPQYAGLFTIPLNGTDSNILSKNDFGRCLNLNIASNSAVPGTITVMVNPKEDGSGVWTTLQSPPGTDVTIATLKSVSFNSVPYMALRLHTSVIGAIATFDVTGQVQG